MLRLTRCFGMERIKYDLLDKHLKMLWVIVEGNSSEFGDKLRIS